MVQRAGPPAGVPSAEGSIPAERALIPNLIQPQWVSEASLEKLENLGLSEEAIQRVLQMIVDGLIPAPLVKPSSGPVAAALDLLTPEKPHDPAGYARLLTCLYDQSERLINVCLQLWLSRLEDVAGMKLENPPEDLNLLLQSHLDDQWIVADCLGLPLAGTFETILPQSLPFWKLASVEFAAVSQQTSTEAFYMGLIAGDLTKPFEKVNALDNLIHARKMRMKDLARLAGAEFEVALRKIVRRLDPGKPLIIYGDHGFRLTPDGSGFSHGGSSTAERIIPVFRLIPV